MRYRFVLSLLGCLAVLSPSRGASQSAESPHGDLPDGLTCQSCHTTRAWSPLRDDPDFRHGDTGFELDGRHADAVCARCHAGLVFDRIDTGDGDCATCHVDVHQGTLTRPCAACHSTESFSLVAGVVHPADFPLEGAHLQTSCESCHVDDVGGAFRPLDRECVTCHMDEYARSSLVDHRQLGFGTDCTECHGLLDFRDVVFDHFTISGGFELLGRHAGIECVACHSNGDGSVPGSATGSGDCVACHLDDYEDEHGGSGFPTECLQCHDVSDWDGASFQHTFSIFSGPHGSAWEGCQDCHTVPSDPSVYSCFACHGRTEMDDKHRERSGYAYDSPTCVGCHPTGRS